MAVNKGKAAVRSSSGGTDKNASETDERKRFARHYGKGVADNESSPAADKDKMPPTTSKKEALESSFPPGEDPVDPHFAHNPYVKQPPSGRFQEHLPQGLARTKSEDDETKTPESPQKEHSTDASNTEAPPGSKRAILQALTARMRAKIKKVEEESLPGRASSVTPQASPREPAGMFPRSPSTTTPPRNRLLKQVHQPATPDGQGSSSPPPTPPQPPLPSPPLTPPPRPIAQEPTVGTASRHPASAAVAGPSSPSAAVAGPSSPSTPLTIPTTESPSRTPSHAPFAPSPLRRVQTISPPPTARFTQRLTHRVKKRRTAHRDRALEREVARAQKAAEEKREREAQAAEAERVRREQEEAAAARPRRGFISRTLGGMAEWLRR
ncbi:uncharacterized protein J3D65DRAFT_622679 [Phyllosticta citribraziliensis]|uniref:Uncharacterized protein n=1 Tax=Phyllosticta citribraziliensis TaxID=989973 RepID=A0ABR1LVX9_9PEZI